MIYADLMGSGYGRNIEIAKIILEMSFHISSKQFSNPLKELLLKLTDYFNSINSDYFVIGATARDIIFSGIHKLALKDARLI